MAMPLVGAIVLLFQALLLAHGGISTLGANIFSLSIAGPFVAYALFRLLTSARLPKSLVIFIATFCGSMATYIVTSFQLAVVYPDAVTGVMGAAWKFLGIFAITQVPLSIIEGILTVIVLRLLEKSQAKTATSVKASSTQSSTKSSLRPQFIWLSILAVVCLALPILAGLFDIGAGTDDQAGEMIGRLTPDFNPTPFLESFEPSEFAEPLLFALQVAIGIALFAWGYYQLIYKRHQSKQKEQEA
jgi:cobalt uptake substrate-specific transmembrane region